MSVSSRYTEEVIKAVIFDCFGVLATEGWLPFKRRHFSHDPGLEQEATDLSKQLNAGRIGYDEFIGQVANLARVSYHLVARQITGNKANTELFEYIEQSLKPRYKIGLLSNAGSNKLHEMFSERQIALFDEIALSYETGAVKPDRRAYEAIVEKLGIDAGQAVFVDDQIRHCTGAREAGLLAVEYKDFPQMKRELEELL